MRVGEIIDRIIEKTGVSRLEAGKTCDILVAGREDQEVTGIVTTFMATVEVIEKAVELGANFIVTHEPTWFTGPDKTDWVDGDPVYRAKKALIEQHDIAIWRFHDHMHMEAEDGIYRGLTKELGWESYLISGTKDCFEIPETTLGSLAYFFSDLMEMEVVQLVGRPDMPVKRVGILVGGGSLGLGTEEMPMQYMERNQLDTIICGDIIEWTLSAYVRDAQQMGMNKSMLVLGHERSEEPGMKHLAQWIGPLAEGVEVHFVDAGEPFTYVTRDNETQPAEKKQSAGKAPSGNPQTEEMPAGKTALDAELVMKIHVQCESAKNVGGSAEGYLRVIPIIGGTFEGKVSGTVVSGGADWNTEKPNGGAHVFAKYMLETADHCYIAVENEGFLSPGEDPIIKTKPSFTAAEDGPYAWLNHGVYAGTLTGGEQENEVEIGIYRLA